VSASQDWVSAYDGGKLIVRYPAFVHRLNDKVGIVDALDAYGFGVILQSICPQASVGAHKISTGEYFENDFVPWFSQALFRYLTVRREASQRIGKQAATRFFRCDGCSRKT